MKTVFLLGGSDLEMVTIKTLLEEQGQQVLDKGLGWGAKLSAYAEELASMHKNVVVYTIELEQDIIPAQKIVVVDHHNADSCKPASILQVCEILGVTPSRWHQLVAANDSGYIPGLLAMGASLTEISQVRFEDRKAQGISMEQELEGTRALNAPREYVGETRVFRMAHSKCATINDQLAVKTLATDTDVDENHIIISADGEVNFYGPGNLVLKLKDTFGGWYGGNLPHNGFWGGYANADEVLALLN